MSEYEDFQEIAHCGGQVTLIMKCDTDGRRSHATRVQISRHGEAAWVAMYALPPHGIPIAGIKMGGINQPWEPPRPPGCFEVFLGSDSRKCWGHQCGACDSYFRNDIHPPTYPLTCPYCGYLAAAHDFLTPAQLSYVRHYIAFCSDAFNEPIEPGTAREFVINMDQIADLQADEPKPPFYYSSETQQTRYVCNHCNTFNDIRGRYGYCAGCGWRNNAQMLQDKLTILREKLNTGHSSPDETVKSAVSEFDSCCRNMAGGLTARIPMKPHRKAEFDRLLFHDINSAPIKSMKSMFDIDILRGMDSDLKFLKMMMERRHIFEHNSGVADERYVSESGDPTARQNVLIRETQGNAHQLINGLARMFKNFDDDFHEIFPPTEEPIEYYRKRQEWKGGS